MKTPRDQNRRKRRRRARLAWRQITGIAPRIHHTRNEHARGDIPDVRSRVPADFVDAGEDLSAEHRDAVALAIVILAVVFIALITYFVTQMPQKGP